MNKGDAWLQETTKGRATGAESSPSSAADALLLPPGQPGGARSLRERCQGSSFCFCSPRLLSCSVCRRRCVFGKVHLRKTLTNASARHRLPAAAHDRVPRATNGFPEGRGPAFRYRCRRLARPRRRKVSWELKSPALSCPRRAGGSWTTRPAGPCGGARRPEGGSARWWQGG